LPGAVAVPSARIVGLEVVGRLVLDRLLLARALLELLDARLDLGALLRIERLALSVSRSARKRL
jgi:hypothetical protein